LQAEDVPRFVAGKLHDLASFEVLMMSHDIHKQHMVLVRDKFLSTLAYALYLTLGAVLTVTNLLGIDLPSTWRWSKAYSDESCDA
jgi:hypothetical protein